MHSAARRARATIVLTTWIVALAAWPSIAAGDVSLSDGKIGGTTSTVVATWRRPAGVGARE